MARCNAFLEAGSDSGRSVSVGGRRAQSQVWARLNTDNATQSDCCLAVSASVVGSGQSYKERQRKDGDQRKSIFNVDCPEQDDEYCRIDVRCNARSQNVTINGQNVSKLFEAFELVQALESGELDDTNEGFVARLKMLVGNLRIPELTS